jgi:hypothetical protein
MATVMGVLEVDEDDEDGAAADDDVAGDEAADDAGAELAELLDEPLLTEQPASASAATAASGKVPWAHRLANETFLDILSSFVTN